MSWWPGRARFGWYYTVETTRSLAPLEPWSNLVGYVSLYCGVNGTMSATDTNGVDLLRFYRVQMSPTP